MIITKKSKFFNVKGLKPYIDEEVSRVTAKNITQSTQNLGGSPQEALGIALSLSDEGSSEESENILSKKEIT